MTDFPKVFDYYGLRARVYPALIAGLPSLALLLVFVPWDHIGLPHLVVTSVATVLLFAFADVGRRLGKHVQARLGTGETPEQWYRGNPDLAETAKDRYRNFIASQLGSKAPSEADERSDPHAANDFYNSAGSWIREHTRDTKKFSILLSENITYGFRRNLLGLKPVALAFNAVVLAICVFALKYPQPYFEELPNIREKVMAVITAAVLHSVFMLVAVRGAGVVEASRTYGRQLILSCETLMKPKSSTSKKAGKANARR